MEQFRGQSTVCGTLARKAKLFAAAVVVSLALTACGGDDAPTAASSPGAQPRPGGGPTSPGGALADAGGTPTSPGGAVSSGGAPTNVGGTPTSPGGALVDAGGSPSGSGEPPTDEQTTPGAGTGSVTLSWIPPTMNDDGSPLKLTGYRIYWGHSDDDFTHSVLVENPGLTRYVVEQLTAGTWYFVATALSADRESEFSNVFSMTVR